MANSNWQYVAFFCLLFLVCGRYLFSAVPSSTEGMGTYRVRAFAMLPARVLANQSALSGVTSADPTAKTTLVMHLKPEQLESNGYTLLATLDHKELVPFVRTWLKKPTFYSRLYYAANLILFGLAGALLAWGAGQPGYSIGDRFSSFSYGLALAFLLLPLHEYIHVLAYRSQGAGQTSYAANLKKFYFMALAEGFVANRKEFRVVALAPFVVISALLLLLLPLVPGQWTLTTASTLLMHTAMCSGDFGLLSFFQYHRDQDVVTYDDVAGGVSYFWGKPV